MPFLPVQLKRQEWFFSDVFLPVVTKTSGILFWWAIIWNHIYLPAFVGNRWKDDECFLAKKLRQKSHLLNGII